ncbi:hypothetical protein CAPTEDRAFT_188427 [Capitella teleta]|uniref:Nose resistant-to-fluoxetine protein N-terminal domain-containing protein n=1 Tax=Capitella teleta TaxID=283909 RepID=R7ULS2_CAPTE|nr:hypothetical protein CAPTEDRAFT_188427 [Capitella teleta]|eukprot:ELU04227.1 hypothetical protein CAPTEDRAFT_188427 [Capitella teleta]
MAVSFILVVILFCVLGIEARTPSYGDQKRIALLRKIVLPSLEGDSVFRQILTDLEIPNILTTNYEELMKKANISSDCGKDVELIIQEYHNGKTWALNIMDAQGKIPSGVFQGATKWLGSYDECNKVTHPESSLRGRYCSALLRVPLLKDDFIRWGICVPHSCQATDVEAAIQIWLSVRCLLAFSARNSFSRLLISSAEEGMGCLDGIRVLSISWIIFNNSFFLPIDMYDNILAVWDLSKTLSFQIVTNGSTNVDSFFFLGYCIKHVPPMITNFITFQWMSAYMLILCIYVLILPFAGDGPLWEAEQFTDSCIANWWTNLLYINNLYSKRSQCMFWTWYLANEMQFFILSPIFIYLLRTKLPAGISITILSIIASCAVSSAITYLNNYPASDAVGLANVTMFETNFFNDVYITPWCRIGPYLVGILCGFCLYKTSASFDLPVPPIFLWLVIWTCTFFIFAFLAGSRGGEITRWANAIFAGIHRVAWGIILFAVVFLCCRGHGGPINALLSWPGFRPFCNTTFFAYLTHPILIQWTISVARDPMHLSLGSLVSEKEFTLMSLLRVVFKPDLVLPGKFVTEFCRCIRSSNHRRRTFDLSG